MPADWTDAVTYTLLGTHGVDSRLGYETAVGDIDEDGLSDIVIAGIESLNVYLVLGSTLAGYDPGTYQAADVADYVLTLTEWDYHSNAAGLTFHAGALYVGNPTVAALPMAYRIPWSSLVAAGPGTYTLADVADIRFEGSRPYGLRNVVCDVNGDGSADFFLSGFLLLGPLSPPSVDVDAALLVTEYVGHGDGGCLASACADINGDGTDDIVMQCSEPDTRENVVNVYYGGASFGSTGTFDYGDTDVSVRFSYDASVVDWYLQAAPESVGDWNGDGNQDLIINSYWYRYGAPPWSSDFSVFLGGEGFYPSGTALTQTDRYLSVADPEDMSLGFGASVAGDLNGDGIPELVIGQPQYAEGKWGHVYVRYCPPTPGAHSVDDFSETTYESDEEPEDGLGHSVFASGDVDGNGVNDLIATSPYYTDGDGAVHIVLATGLRAESP